MPAVPFRIRGQRLERAGSADDATLVGQRLRQEACNCHSLCLCEFQAACYATKARCVLHRRWRGSHATAPKVSQAAQAQTNASRRRSRRHQLSVVTLQTSTNTTSPHDRLAIRNQNQNQRLNQIKPAHAHTRLRLPL